VTAGCGSEGAVNPLPQGSTGTTTASSGTSANGTGTGGTAGTGGAGGTGGGTGTLLRSVEERNPFGNVAATDNLLWDGDFEWSSPFSDQYGWLFGPPYEYAFPPATIGAACRSGVKCVTLPKGKAVLGVGVGSKGNPLEVTAFARPKKGGCDGVAISLIQLASLGGAVKIGPDPAEPDSAGWCLYRATVPSYPKKVYLLIANKTGEDLVVDDAVVRPAKVIVPPAPPPMAPPTADDQASMDEARAAIEKLRGPHVAPPNAAKKAFEEQQAR